MSKPLTIGLFGFGCVGQGLYHVLNNSTGFKANIAKIAVKHREKERSVSKELITYDKYEILNDPNINVVVELIDDAEEAFNIVSEAIKNGKHVVTANKKMLAYHLEELYALQAEHKVSLLYEAAVCGSIPIIRTLEEYFDNEQLDTVSGIFNGTTNYILTKVINEKLTYGTALRQAQEQGFAESDPTNDVEGFDPKFKSIILAFHAFGIILKPSDILNIGITTLHERDIVYASEKGYKIKLAPVITRNKENRISVAVLPRFIRTQDHLFNVDNEFNGVIVKGEFSGEQFLQGKGAGSYPTGAAVLSDISALSHGYRYEFKKHVQSQAVSLANDTVLKVYIRYNTVLDLERFDAITVNETYAGDEYKYVIAEVPLESLHRNREYILEQGLFVALVNPEPVTSSAERHRKSVEQETINA